MLKKISALVLLSFLISCGTSKSNIRTSKKSTASRSGSLTKVRNVKPRASARAASSTVATKRKDDRKTEVLESTSRTVVYADLVKKYVLDYKEIAKDNMRRLGVPASIALAQGILESGAGKGTLCINANNHFGIKCHTGWTGETVYHDDDSEQECFRKYEKAADSYNDHSLFLTTRGRYASLFSMPKDDYEAWAHGLKAAGYATDPKYPEKLIGLIERYELAKYDAEVLGKTYKPVVKAPVPVQNTVIITDEPPKPAVNTKPAETAAADGSHRVAQGETLYSISKKHNTTVDEIIRLNELSGNAISIGQVLKVK